MDNKSYVYVYLDPRKPGNYVFGELVFDYEPFYIGKGVGNRMTDHLREAKKDGPLEKWHNPLKINKIRKILKEGYDPLIELIYQSLSDQEAEIAEERCISLVGRLVEKTGPLANKASGNPFKGTMILRGEAHWGYGHARTLETRQKISENHQDVSGSRNSRAKRWRLISPVGVITYCHGNLKEVCSSFGIGETLLRGCRGSEYTFERYSKTYETKKSARFQQTHIKERALKTIGWKLEEIK